MTGFDLIFILLAIFIVVISSLVIYARWNYGTLEAMGIPVVKPHWLLGSNWNYTELIHHWEDEKRAKEIGPVYGVYNGRNPEVFVADPEIVRMILLQQSEYFTNKREVNFGHETINEILEVLNGEKWKVIRSALSPLFTTAKMRQLSEKVENLSKDYVHSLVKDAEKNAGRVKVEFKKFMSPFAIEVIGECLCGMKLENARDPNNQFVKNMKVAVMGDLEFDWTFNLTQVFPFLLKLLPTFPNDAFKFFEDLMKSIVDGRQNSNSKTQDTVKTLLELRNKINTPEFKRLGITEKTVYGQAFEFFVASYLGITSQYSDFTYHIATNEEVNQKLMHEVDTMLEKSEGIISYETVSELHYLTACAMETFRKTPAFFRPDRVCTKDWVYNGYSIKKGTDIMIPIYPIHHNPKIYPQPEKFIPDRFLPENKDKLAFCSFLTFGEGSRQCLGVRFVYELFKIFTVNLLKEFRIEKRDDTVWVEHKGNHLFVQKDPVYVDLVKR